MNISSDNITSLEPNQIFVFGSNLSGRHGKGAAKQALKFGAIYGCGWGLYGQTFAIPTKGHNLEILSIKSIAFFIDMFLRVSKTMCDKDFLVTQIGCGLSNYKPSDIAPFFKDAIYLDNVYLPKSFINIINVL
jgi:hypothetical protein